MESGSTRGRRPGKSKDEVVGRGQSLKPGILQTGRDQSCSPHPFLALHRDQSSPIPLRAEHFQSSTVTLTTVDNKLGGWGKGEDAPASCTEKEVQLRILLRLWRKTVWWADAPWPILSEPLTNKKDDYAGPQTHWSTLSEGQAEEGQAGITF